jgi:predicted enzyme related to lactoylglutathione lyase
MAGSPVHIEIPAQDTSRAQEFYKNLFGWEFQSMEGPFEYHMARLSETSGGAVFPGDTGAIRVYFDVDDINAGAARLKELGGKADDPQPVPGMGWFATGSDPEGNPIGLWQTDPSAPAPEG